MEKSDSINELAAALSKAQANYGTVKKSGKNPMFKSEYSTFDDMMTAVRKPLADNGLAFSQLLSNLDGKPALTSMIMHESGQWINDTVPLITMTGNRGINEIQAFGSVLTYMKRYSGGAILGVGGDNDDDGNSATPQAHWIEDEATRKKFWAYWHDRGLTNDEVHAALKVEHVAEFDGDKKAAMDAIEAYIDRNTA